MLALTSSPKTAGVLGPCQISMMELFCKNNEQLSEVVRKYFVKKELLKISQNLQENT